MFTRILYWIKSFMSDDDVLHYPFPIDKGKWITYDLRKFNGYDSAVNWSKKHNLPKVVVKQWSETLQKHFYSKTYWSYDE